MLCLNLTTFLFAALVFASPVSPARASNLLPGFSKAPFTNEQVREVRTSEGIRAVINTPLEISNQKPTLIVFYATPNGNTIEQTLGAEMEPGLDWHFDIQHIAAQTRRLREVNTRENIVLVVTQADERSWPAWRAKHADNANLIRSFVESTTEGLPGSQLRIAMTGHSGGGSFLFGYINGGEAITDNVVLFAFLDANYSYSNDDRHGDKLLAWLKGSPERRLVVLAYDDREIALNGKKVVGPTGGTWRASFRMIDRFRRDVALCKSTSGDLISYTGLDGRLNVILDRNPANRILHTVLVETNGFLHVMTLGTPDEDRAGTYRGPRSYTGFITPLEVTYSVAGTMAFRGIPPRKSTAPGGHAFMNSIAGLGLTARENAIFSQLKKGNVPDFLRNFKSLRIRWSDSARRVHTGLIHVMPDYLAVGSNTDFVRVPMTPMTAQRLADLYGCSLITRRISNIVYSDAESRLDPKPMTENRESVSTFIAHNDIIEGQRAGKPLGMLTCGIKKDVVLTNLLATKPTRVAIYGWHYTNGTPIQPLSTVHVNTYVDYSHGIRFMSRECVVDGKKCDIEHVMKNPDWCALVSDEGPLTIRRY